MGPGRRPGPARGHPAATWQVALRSQQIDLVSKATGLSTVECLQWTQRAQRLHVSEADAQLSGANGVFALAVRQTSGEAPVGSGEGGGGGQ
jgi:hypothetical protein